MGFTADCADWFRGFEQIGFADLNGLVSRIDADYSAAYLACHAYHA